MKTTDKYPESSPLVEITVSDPSNTLRRKGKGTAADTPLRTATVRRTDFDSWEEVPVAIAFDEAAAEAKRSEEEYAAEVERLIRARYSLSAELAVLRQRYSKPDEFAAYDSFAESCKAQARELVNNTI